MRVFYDWRRDQIWIEEAPGYYVTHVYSAVGFFRDESGNAYYTSKCTRSDDFVDLIWEYLGEL